MAVKKQFQSFDDLLAQSDIPVLVDFYATWCGPCQMMVPILAEVQTQMGKQLQVVKIDSDKYPELASKYHIEALPTLVLFKDGKPVDRIEGAMQAKPLVERLKTLI